MAKTRSTAPAVSPRVLVVDDDPERISWFRARLDARRTVFATSFDEAVAAFHRYAFDVAFLDHDLGCTRNGTDLAYWLVRRLPRRRRPSFVVHSSNVAGALAMLLTLEKAECNVEVQQFPPRSLEVEDDE